MEIEIVWFCLVIWWFEPITIFFCKSPFSLSLSKMEKHNTMTSPSSPTFVQADTHTFRDLVQTLTGSSTGSEKLHVNPPSKLFPKCFTPVTSHQSSPVTLEAPRAKANPFSEL